MDKKNFFYITFVCMLYLISLIPLFSMERIEQINQEGQSEAFVGTVVLDLDKTLLHNPSPIKQFQASSNKLFFNFDHYSIDCSAYTYLLSGYTYSFLRYLKNRNLDIFFFSSARQARNYKVVENLWEKIFHEKFPRQKIRSRRHLIKMETYDYTKDFWSGSLKKDLRTIRYETKSVILIDDKESFVRGGQERHLLKISNESPLSMFSSYARYMDMLKMSLEEQQDFNLEAVLDNALCTEFFQEDLLAYFKLLYIAAVLEEALEKSFMDPQERGIEDFLPDYLEFGAFDFPRSFLDKKMLLYKKGLDLLRKYRKEEEKEFPEIESILFDGMTVEPSMLEKIFENTIISQRYDVSTSKTPDY